MNPYSAPQTDVFVKDDLSFETRKSYHNFELAIRTLGSLIVVPGLLGVVLVLIGFVVDVLSSSHKAFGAALPALTMFVLLCWFGDSLHRLSRAASQTLSVIIVALLYFKSPAYSAENRVILIAIASFFLWLLNGKKSRFVMSADYRAVMALTPGYQPNGHLVRKVLMVLFLTGMIVLPLWLKTSS